MAELIGQKPGSGEAEEASFGLDEAFNVIGELERLAAQGDESAKLGRWYQNHVLKT